MKMSRRPGRMNTEDMAIMGAAEVMGAESGMINRIYLSISE